SGPLAEKLVFLLQKEVAEKAAAQCGSKDYSYFSLHTSFFAKTSLGNTYGPESFRPRPKIDSKILIIEPLKISEIERQKRFNALKYASILFNQRRKMALPILKKQFEQKNWEQLFTELSIDFKARPENISPEQMLKLFN
ncbi:MAG: rRNA adenine N-6-methyltransferase family protein, partial [Candidatus Riflebacteria bacterium]|nr:rRNA adenine N-6-methyltransferase family protein [Candidatus Riflebacteria bacterium]